VRWLRRASLLLLFALAAAPAAADDVPIPPEEREQAPPSVDSPPPAARRVVLRAVKFGSDTAYIEPVSAGVLEMVAEHLRENPELRVRIAGYTDDRASQQHNLELSLARAESVKRILVGFGIAAERLETVGLGEDDPVAGNDTEEGRALNRRVELTAIE
jgi:OOP family OmpA-OmpF porin